MSGMFIVANHKQDLQPQRPKEKKTAEFPSDMEHICFLSNLPKKTLYFWLNRYKKLDITAASGY